MSGSEVPKAKRRVDQGDLHDHEAWWRDHQPWLKEKGYILRERYQPDWVPSWKTDPRKVWIDCEDAVTAKSYNILDAIRRDGSLVALKSVKASQQPYEVEIGRLFSSEPLVHDPNNYCVPILEVLQVPDDEDTVIIVMPLLYHLETAPPETIGEGVEVIRQLFEGLNLMHQNNIAHRDCKDTNFMAALQPLFDVPPHPFSDFRRRDFKGAPRVRSSRTRKPVKHYLLDFGLSKLYKPENAPHLEPAGWGGDHSVPEFLAGDDTLCNPFHVDVYCAGNLVRTCFTEGDDDFFPRKIGFEFLHDLINDMVQADPAKRPTMKEVVSRYNDLIKDLSDWKLRSRVALATESRFRRISRSFGHWIKQSIFVAMRVPAIPHA